jgi:hypothetical protein
MRPPRDVLEGYFRELAAVEAWAIDPVGGPQALQEERVSDELMDQVFEEFEARLAGVHRRYASPPIALVKRGGVTWNVPPEHSRYVIIGEESIGTDRVRILARQADGWLLWSTLERGEDGWRVIMEEHDFEDPT